MTGIAVVSAGLSNPSSTRLLADRLAAAVAAVAARDGEELHLGTIELRELAHPLADHLLTGFATDTLAAALASVTSADGLIVVTPVFSGSYSGLFKSFFDVIEPGALRGMPVLLAATGGTARHSLALEHALRPLLSYLGALTVPTAVYAATEDWGSAGLDERIDRAARDLANLVAPAQAGAGPLDAGATRRPAADPFELTTDFEQLLGGLGR